MRLKRATWAQNGLKCMQKLAIGLTKACWAQNGSLGLIKNVLHPSLALSYATYICPRKILEWVIWNANGVGLIIRLTPTSKKVWNHTKNQRDWDDLALRLSWAYKTVWWRFQFNRSKGYFSLLSLIRFVNCVTTAWRCQCLITLLGQEVESK